MSKSKMNTRDKILDKALQTFNERGIEYVGLRELAAMLDMRVSNITYYFPTKDDLVYQISVELSKTNAAIIVPSERMTMHAFLQMLNQVFHNHLRFRCLFLSFVHLMEQNKQVAAAYKKTQTVRSATLKSNISTLAASGYLNVSDETDKEFLVSALALINRFWISEAAISFRALSDEAQIQHYLTMITKLFFPYTTAKAKKEIENFLADL